MIVVDSSAVIAILFSEPSSAALVSRLGSDPALREGYRQRGSDPDRLMSVASYLEVGTVLAGRRRSNKSRAIDDLNAFLDEAGITLSPVDADQARLALQARISYGRGMGHGGLLNFGDAFSYALAKSLDAPLLFIGDDFASTDIASAL